MSCPATPATFELTTRTVALYSVASKVECDEAEGQFCIYLAVKNTSKLPISGLSLAVAGVSGTGPGGRASRVGKSRVRKPGGKTVRREGEVCLLTGKGGMAAGARSGGQVDGLRT